MAINGTIEEAGLPDVLQLLTLGRKSGCLTVADGATQGKVYLDVGRVSYATVANRLDRLGDLLVKSGRITREQLSEAADQQARASSKRQIGRILVDSGHIDRADLEKFVRLQVEEAVYYLFTWKQGTFGFTSDERPPHQTLLVSLDPESLLLEGARRVDEWSLIEKKIPSFDLVYRLNRQKLSRSAADDLTDEQKRIVPLLDGTRDVTGLIDLSGMGEFDVGKALYGLMVAGFVQLVERRAHVRHLDYRELLAYVVREAEFADPQRRKDAARHIVDCPPCAERLRTIHVRRTTEAAAMSALASAPGAGEAVPAPAPGAAVSAAATGAVPALTARVMAPAPPARPASPVPAVKLVETAPAAVPPPVPAAREPAAAESAAAASERRARDRRAGRDRRHFERRAGHDRRRAVSASWGSLNTERRMGPRRDDERRTTVVRESRAGESDRRVAALMPPEPSPPASRPVGPGERHTGPRRLAPLEAGDRDDPRRAVAVADHGNGGQAITAVVPAVSLPLDEAPAPVQAREPSPTEPPAPVRAVSRPSMKQAGEPSGDMQWLVTPQESLEMFRASTARLRATDDAIRASRISAADPVEKPAPGVPNGPNGRAAAARSTASASVIPPVEARTPVRVSPAPGRSFPPEGGRRTGAASWRLPFRVRWLGLAASIAGVGLLGYLAGHGGKSGRPGETTEAVAANAPVDTGPAQAALPPASPPAGAHGSNPPAPAGRSAVAAPAEAAPQRNRSATEPNAAPERGQRAAPAPVTTAVPPPSLPAPAPTPAQRAAPGTPVAVAAQPPTAQPAAPRVETPPPQPAPSVGIIHGAVHDASGRALVGARVSVRGTALSAVTDGSGAYLIQGVPDGPVVVQATADGRVPGSVEVRSRAGTSVGADLTLAAVPAAAAPDPDLAGGGWAQVDRAEAITFMGGSLGAIEGLAVESIARSTTGTRPRVRVTQLTESGQRIVLTETRAGAAVGGEARVTAVRVMPPSEAYPLATGTASLGTLLITAKAGIPADAMRSHLERLAELR